MELSVVLEIASSKILTGFSEQESPASYYPSYILKEKKKSQNQETVEYIGHKVQEKRDLYNIEYPIQRGRVQNFEIFEKFVNYIYYEDLKVAPEDFNCFTSLSPMETVKGNYKMHEIFFEKFNVPTFSRTLEGSLVLMASGRNTAMVLDIGEGYSSTYCCTDTKTFWKSHYTMEFGGQDMTEYLMNQLRDKGHYFYSNNHREWIKYMKENVCTVGLDMDDLEKQFKNSKFEKENEKSYTLPDGTKINVGMERFLCGEVLFNPSSGGFNHISIHNFLYKSLWQVDINSRSILCGNILLAGGVTYAPGFAQRLERELVNLAPSSMKIRIIQPEERKYFIWIGGAILSSLSSFSSNWMTKPEYEESNLESLLHGKNFKSQMF